MENGDGFDIVDEAEPDLAPAGQFDIDLRQQLRIEQRPESLAHQAIVVDDQLVVRPGEVVARVVMDRADERHLVGVLRFGLQEFGDEHPRHVGRHRVERSAEHLEF